MDKNYLLKMRLISAALGYMASQTYLETQDPGPHDDAEMEMKDDMLTEAARAYVEAIK